MDVWLRVVAVLVVALIVFSLAFSAILMGDLWGRWYAYKRMGRAEQAALLMLSTRFFYMRRCSDSIMSECFVSPYQFAQAVDHSLRNHREFRLEHGGLMVHSGFPPDIKAMPLVILHIHGSWDGINPSWPWVNKLLSFHAKPVQDMTERYVHLKLPEPVVVIGVKLPTDAASLLNFAQEDDCFAITQIVSAVRRRAPRAKLVISGDCLGALRVLRWLDTRQYPFPVDALLLHSPLPTMRRIFHSFYERARIFMPNFRAEPTKELKPCPLPALVFYLEDDTNCSDDDLPWVHRVMPAATAIRIPSSAKDDDGRPIRHGLLYRWPPGRVHTLNFLSSLTPARLVGSRPAYARVWAVTALYDIGREQRGDGRPWAKYLEWFEGTLQMNVPLVVFVDDSLRPMVQRVRSAVSAPTDIICRPFSECSEWPHLSRVRSILSSMMKRPTKDLCLVLPEYSVTVFSKFGWMRDAITRHRHEADVFVWIDAGLKRSWSAEFRPDPVWPHPLWSSLVHRSNRLWIQGTLGVIRGLSVQESDIGTSITLVLTTVFAGTAEIILQLCDLVLNVWRKEILQAGLVDTEQMAVSLLLCRQPELFQTIVPHDWTCNFQRWPDFCRHEPELVNIWQHPPWKLSTFNAHLLPPLDIHRMDGRGKPRLETCRRGQPLPTAINLAGFTV
jgi:hypothetical protein